jgi:hypothetical protein
MGRFLTQVFLLFISAGLFAQESAPPEFYILDTLKIENAVSVSFKPKRGYGVPVVVSKNRLASWDQERYRNGQKYLEQNGCLVIDGWRFLGYLKKELHNSNVNLKAKDSLRMQLLYDDFADFVFRKSKFEPYKSVEFNYQKVRKNIRVAEIPYEYFLFILIKSSKLREWTSGRTDFKEVDNLYIPVVVIMPWIKDDPE